MTNEPNKRMLVSELIRDLTERIAEHGDMHVHIGLNRERAEAIATAVINDTIPYLAILDAPTADLLEHLNLTRGEMNA